MCCSLRFCGDVVVVKSLQNHAQVGKRVTERGSGKQEELISEQERRKSESRAAEKRPKSTEKHEGVPDVLQERLEEAKWKQQGV